MKCEVTLTANAGVIIAIDGKEILIDALHNEKTPRFSTLSSEMLEAVWSRFSQRVPLAVFATHLHQDHFSRSLWNEAHTRWPETSFVSPKADLESTIMLKDLKESFALDEVHVDAMLLPHEGKEYKSVVNYGYIIEIKGFTILILGDCALEATDKILELINGRSIDLALLNFPWITLTKPRAFIQNILAPKHLGLIHLPFPQDDRGGYLPAAKKSAKSLFPMDVHVLCEPMQKLELL